ncbi:MAG: redoxin domain-containing protein [Bryobacterales bacterium]|nr:redoxin domain-containing protein [Bryobacterales bacterium]
MLCLLGFLLLAAPPTPSGPAVGQPIPAFSATDQAGRTRTLADLAGKKGLVLLFVRSADW